jgi:hypothetical protein
MNTPQSKLEWRVTFRGDTTNGILQRDLVKVASVIIGKDTDGIIGYRYKNTHPNEYLRERTDELEFEFPDFNTSLLPDLASPVSARLRSWARKQPHWQVLFHNISTGGTETKTTVRVKATMKAEGESDPHDSGCHSIIGSIDMTGGSDELHGCIWSMNCQWMSWKPQSHPIVEISFTDCQTGKKLDLARVCWDMSIRQISV